MSIEILGETWSLQVFPMSDVEYRIDEAAKLIRVDRSDDLREQARMIAEAISAAAGTVSCASRLRGYAQVPLVGLVD